MRRFAGREGVGQEGLRGFQVPFLHACIAAQGETQLDTSEPAEGPRQDCSEGLFNASFHAAADRQAAGARPA